ncbi:MAG: hypothetical protein COB84_01415 [Rhodobacteraceae bacterium]|nr:MAG: hypothetical protein COB84_01415 [Paracoccaceae bacterium]
MKLVYFEDIVIPQRIEGPSMFLEPSEMVSFAKTWNPLPIHLVGGSDGIPTASGAMLLALRLRLIHQMDTQLAVIVSFGYDEVRFHRPAYAKDQLTLIMEYLEKRPSSSKPDRGIVTMRQSLLNKNQETVMSLIDTILVRKRLIKEPDH